jgi:hypothetical protein
MGTNSGEKSRRQRFSRRPLESILARFALSVEAKNHDEEAAGYRSKKKLHPQSPERIFPRPSLRFKKF